jgi:hypothetical protein
MLHDCPLTSLNIDWTSGVLTIHLQRHVEPEDLIQAVGLKRFSLSRLEEWGPSGCIDELTRLSRTSDGLQAIEIRMQSGDVIEIVAEGIQLPSK